MKPHHFRSDKLYYGKIQDLEADKRITNDKVILENALMEIGFISEKRPKLGDLNHELVPKEEVILKDNLILGNALMQQPQLADSNQLLLSEKVNCKLEIISSFNLCLISNSRRLMNMKTTMMKSIKKIVVFTMKLTF